MLAWYTVYAVIVCLSVHPSVCPSATSRCSTKTLNLGSRKQRHTIKFRRGHPQLAKIHNSSLDTSHSSGNLGFIVDEHLTFQASLDKLHLSPKPVTISHSSTSLYPAPRFVNCPYHCYLYRPLQTGLL